MKLTTIDELYKIYNLYPEITTDSRNCKSGSLFFALKGDNFNGNKFALSALESWPEYAIVDDPEFDVSEKILIVENVLDAYRELARR